MAKIRMAQYGTKHGHARGKLQAMLVNPDVEVAGVFEPDEERRAKLQTDGSAFNNVRLFTDAAEMLEDETIVAVASEGDNAESLNQTEEIVNAGKHVWYDKPAGENWEQWQRVINTAQQKSLLVQMGYMLRYHSSFKQVTEWARSGFLGNVFSVRAHMSTNISEEARKRISQHVGGIFFDLGGHVLDQVLWMLGKPEKVTSFLRNDGESTEPFKDNTLTVYEFEKGMAFISISALEPRPMARRFEVYGTEGSAIIVEPFEPGHTIRLCLQKTKEGYSQGEQIVKIDRESRQRLYELELDAFLATIAGTQQPDRPVSHELLVQETLLRATGVLAYSHN
jgi:predicted dehydrogenase